MHSIESGSVIGPSCLHTCMSVHLSPENLQAGAVNDSHLKLDNTFDLIILPVIVFHLLNASLQVYDTDAFDQMLFI